ncbi:MAG TPA: hypothetical protein VFF73_35065 [Planctomycetota bacterium]|nr:hypothetical protein [Planctomycetota bacterium]
MRDWCHYLATLLDERLRAVERAPKPDGLELRLRALEAEVRADLPEGEVALREALALALRGAGEVSGPLDPDGPLDLVVQVAAERVGMKVVDSERAPVLARRIEQILDELDAQQVTRAVVVRTRAVAPSWRRCRELMDELRGRGGEVVVVTDDERATLHALARLDARAVARLAHELPIIRRLTERPSAVTA